MPAVIYQKAKGKVRPLKDQILVVDMEKGEKITRGGIIIGDDNGSDRGIRPRWCRVYGVGSSIDYLSADQWILVEHGRWTYGMPVEQEDGSEIYVQRVDPEGVLLVSDEKPF